MVEAVLLPFKGKIIYDGMISNYPIHFGRGLKNSLKNDALLAEGKYGIITELPENIKNAGLGNSLETELLVMMKTKSSREHNWYRIEEILEDDPNLMQVYIKELGRINSRQKKKAIKELGIKKRCYAVYEDTIICSDKTQRDLEEKLADLISDEEKLKGIFIFKV